MKSFIFLKYFLNLIENKVTFSFYNHLINYNNHTLHFNKNWVPGNQEDAQSVFFHFLNDLIINNKIDTTVTFKRTYRCDKCLNTQSIYD